MSVASADNASLQLWPAKYLPHMKDVSPNEEMKPDIQTAAAAADV